MITTRGQYQYVGGDLSQVVIDGGIMPLRPAATKDILRGEDVAFMLEGAIERRTWWNRVRFYAADGSGTLQSTVVNPRRYAPAQPNQWPFTAAVSDNTSAISSTGTVGEANDLINSLYTDAAHWGSGYFLSANMDAKPFVDTSQFSAFDGQPRLLTSDREAVDFSNGELRDERIASMFANLAKPKYGIVSVQVNSQSYSATWEKGSGSSPVYFGYLAEDGLHDEDLRQMYSLPNSVYRTQALLYTGAYSEMRIWAVCEVNGRYYDGSANHNVAKCALLDVTNLCTKELTSSSFYLYSPRVTRAWLMQQLAAAGAEVYTAEVRTNNRRICEYNVTLGSTAYVTVKLNPRTSWT